MKKPFLSSLTLKRLLTAVLAIAIAVSAFATAQYTERINDGGIRKGMANCLLELDSVSFSKLKSRIPDKMASTALWRNYIGQWEIKNDSLFLKSVLIEDKSCDTLQFVPAVIDDIYASRRTPSGYFADWVSDTVRIVSGDILRYRHMGWLSDWKTEEMVTIENGLVKDRIVYKNRVVNPVDESKVESIINSLDLGFIPERILLQLGYRGLDKNGKPTGYKVEVKQSCGDKAIDDKVVRAFENAAVIRKLVPIDYVRGQYKHENLYLTIPKSKERSAG